MYNIGKPHPTIYKRVTLVSEVQDPTVNPNYPFYWVLAADATGSTGGFTYHVNLSYLPSGVNLSLIQSGQEWLIYNPTTPYIWCLDKSVGGFLDTGWSSTTPSDPAYRQIDNIVYFRGLSSGGTTSWNPFTLPLAQCPPSTVGVATAVEISTGYVGGIVIIGTDGVVTGYYGGTWTSFWLTGISFPIN